MSNLAEHSLARGLPVSDINLRGDAKIRAKPFNVRSYRLDMNSATVYKGLEPL